MAEQFQHGGGAGADSECHQKLLAFNYKLFEQWHSQGWIFEGGAKQGCTREGARGKTRGSIGVKLQNDCDIRGRV